MPRSRWHGIRRTHEIGIRMTLGENARGILRLILLQSLRPVIAGAVLGLVGAAAVSSILLVLLFGTSPLDPFTFIGMVLLLFVVAALASYRPAHRAAQIDPASALRHG